MNHIGRTIWAWYEGDDEPVPVTEIDGFHVVGPDNDVWKSMSNPDSEALGADWTWCGRLGDGEWYDACPAARAGVHRTANPVGTRRVTHPEHGDTFIVGDPPGSGWYFGQSEGYVWGYSVHAIPACLVLGTWRDATWTGPFASRDEAEVARERAARAAAWARGISEKTMAALTLIAEEASAALLPMDDVWNTWPAMLSEAGLGDLAERVRELEGFGWRCWWTVVGGSGDACRAARAANPGHRLAGPCDEHFEVTYMNNIVILDCTNGIPERAALSALLCWEGAHGSYSAWRYVIARTPFGDALTFLRGTSDRDGEHITITGAIEGGRNLALGLDALIAGAIDVPWVDSVPVLATRRNLAGDWSCSLVTQ